jgi:multidrug resistance efflux pump
VSGKGVVSALSKDDAVKGSLQAAERVANLLSERMSTTSELTLLEQSRSRSADSLATLNAIYDDGNVRAAAAGTIGAKVPVPGQVVRFGDQLMQINGGRTYILAYLPDSYLFSIREGMAVNVRSGGETAQGRIDKILGPSRRVPEHVPSARPFAAGARQPPRRCVFRGFPEGLDQRLRVRFLLGVRTGLRAADAAARI